MKNYTLISPCFFGMEKMLAREITNLGYEIIKTEDGRITYKTDEFGIAKSNMWLRCAERVHLKIAEFEAKSFDELFENTKRINWSRYIPYGVEITDENLRIVEKSEEYLSNLGFSQFRVLKKMVLIDVIIVKNIYSLK
ncbi:methylase [Clostridioides difficile]|nr:methylase [Clostridioides difficile]